jgi:hypothetical protein
MRHAISTSGFFSTGCGAAYRKRAENGFQKDALRILDQLSAAIKNDILPSGPYTLPGLMPNVVAGRVTQMFDLHGPNMVVDMGANSLFQSIEVAAGFLAHQECKIILAGGVNAARTSPEDFEGAFMMALTTPEIAKEHGLPIECYLSIGEDGGVRPHPRKPGITAARTGWSRFPGRWPTITGSRFV